jgi:pimeloyl-ACP methyl ester carboxylesterase
MNMIKTKSFPLAVYAQGNTSAEKLAVVLPGKLDTKDYPHMRGHVDHLASLGFYALSFDPPGTWESPGPISLYTMAHYLQAIKELISHFHNQPTLLVGHSRGGSMAMWGAIEIPEVIGFVSIMSFYSFKPDVYTAYGDTEWQQQGYKISHRDDPLHPEQDKQFQLPYEFQEEQQQYDFAEGMRHCHKPKLFIAGKEDMIVPAALVKKGYELAADPKELFEVEDGHDYRKHPETIEIVNQRLSVFVSTLLLAE